MINEILVKVSFLKHTLTKKDPGVVEGDYNTTRLVFEFEEDVSNSRVVFKMANPDGEPVLLIDLVDNAVDLVGYDEDGKPTSLFATYGLYPFELVWYGTSGKLTSAPGWLNVSQRQVTVTDNTVKQYLPLLDQLLNGVLGSVLPPTTIDLSAFETEGKIVETYADETTKTTTMEFDEDGNPIKITDADGNETVLTW